MYRVRVFSVGISVFYFLFVCAYSFLNAHGQSLGEDEFDKFVQMSEKERISYLCQVFEKRMRHADNLSYRLESSMGHKKLGVPQSEVVTIRKVFVHRVLNDSYTMRIEDSPVLSAGMVLAGKHQVVSIFFNGKEGITKNYVNVPPGLAGAFWGRIDAREDPISRENYYTAWLNNNFDYGYHPQPTEDYFIFPCLLRNRDQWKIEVKNAEKVVELTSPYPQVFVADKFDGIRKLILDPQKGYMPLIGEYRWEATRRGGNTWGEQRFFVEDSLLVGDVWMPVNMTLQYRMPSVPESEMFVKMNIVEITHGQVSSADMFLKFPEGTEVVDAIEGNAYRTDASGNRIPSTVEELYDLDPSHASVQLSEPPSRKINVVLIVIGVLLIIVGLYIHFKKRYKAS